MKKKEFRISSIKRLKKIALKEKYSRDRYIFLRLSELIGFLRPKSILLYSAMDIEFDTHKLINKCRREGIKVYLPFMGEISFKMVEYRLPLIEKKFGIYEPISLNYKFPKIDLAIVPVVGVDKSLRRVGFGKGMYDRFFENNSRVFIVFVQRSLCFSEDIVTQDHDIKANLIITPEKIIIKGDRDVNRADSSRSGFSFSCRFGSIFGSKKVKCCQLQNPCRAS